MRTILVPALLVALLAATRLEASPPVEESRKGGVRPLTENGAALLEDGLRRSALVRFEVETLNASDLVVFLTEVFESETGEAKGKLQFLTAAGGRRYVVVTLSRWKLSWNERLVILAHELRHAVEVADAPAVTDLASFEALYRSIGWELTAGHFETTAACQASARMRLDVHLATPTAAYSSPRRGYHDATSQRLSPAGIHGWRLDGQPQGLPPGAR